MSCCQPAGRQHAHLKGQFTKQRVFKGKAGANRIQLLLRRPLSQKTFHTADVLTKSRDIWSELQQNAVHDSQMPERHKHVDGWCWKFIPSGTAEFGLNFLASGIIRI